jgi:hypothetical protein
MQANFRMARVLAGLLVAGAGAASVPAFAAVRTPCPAYDASARDKVATLLTSATLGEFRSRYGITGVDVSTLRVLNDSQDGATCQHLNELVLLGSYGRPVFFTAGGFLFVTAATTPTPGRISLTQVPVAVLDSGFGVRGVIGM